MIAALYVEKDGCYYGLPEVDPWDEERDARTYPGPWPVVAHPPCERWGRFAGGGPANPGSCTPGADGGCFKAALDAVNKWGGVIEHPAYSKAWHFFCINSPPKSGGWIAAGFQPGFTCHVEQGHYGHFSRKPTWLYANWIGHYPDLIWGPAPQRIHPRALELHGYEKARRIGMMAMVGGKDKKRIRNATPVEFRDLLLDMARSKFGRGA